MRLHAIWFVPFGAVTARSQGFLFRYCVSMANDRPLLDLKPFDDICPDKNGTSKHHFMN
jgi:hypothetical protein